MISIYSCTWTFTDQAISHDNNASKKTVLIERLQGRRGPRIQNFYHIDLDIYKEYDSRPGNDALAPTYVKTAPGKVHIGVTLPHVDIYYPEVDFTVAPGHNYWITWICLPYPYVAIVDAESSSIVALDSYCPDCDKFIGAELLPSTECLKYMQPYWIKPDKDKRWREWFSEYENQLYRNLCYAAEHGVTGMQSERACSILQPQKYPLRMKY